MTSFFMTLLRFLKAFLGSLRDPEFRAIFVALVTLLVSGTIFYSAEEGWSVIDAIYFCVMTLSTVGDGALRPTTDLSRLFTILYVVVGVGLFLAFIAKLVSQRRRARHLDAPDPDQSDA
jgi:hypothetical protein